MNQHQIFAVLVFLVCLIPAVAATSIVEYKEPIPGSTVATSRTIVFNVTLDDAPTHCSIEIGLTNGTTLGNHSNTNTTVDADLPINLSKSGRTYGLSQTIAIDSTGGNYHNWSLFCGDNIDNSAEVSSGTIGATATFKLLTSTPTAVLPTSGATYTSSYIPLQATTGRYINASESDYCWANIGLTNGSTYTYALTNSSLAQTTHINSTNVNTVIDSANGNSHNATFYCNESGNNWTSSTITFKVDTVDPALSPVQAPVISSSSAALNATVTDNNPSVCAAQIFDEANTTGPTSSLTGTKVGTGSTSYCTYTFSGTDVSADGFFTVQPNATDSVGNANVSLNNFSLVRTALYAGWNVVTWAGPQTNMSKVCNQISGCSQVANFTSYDQSFTTYSTSAATVNDEINISSGWPFLVYVSSDTYMVQNASLSRTNAAANVTLLANNWSIVGIVKDANLTSWATLLNASGSSAITMASYYDADAETFYTCNRDELCAGGITDADDVDLQTGSAIWVLTNASVLAERSAIIGGP